MTNQTRQKKPGLANSLENQISNLRPYILFLMKQEGRSFEKCELCSVGIKAGRHNIHHVRYEKATYYDLRIVCQKCNHAPVNVGLT